MSLTDWSLPGSLLCCVTQCWGQWRLKQYMKIIHISVVHLQEGEDQVSDRYIFGWLWCGLTHAETLPLILYSTSSLCGSWHFHATSMGVLCTVAHTRNTSYHKFTLYCTLNVNCVFYTCVNCGILCILVLPAKGLRMHISCFANSSTLTFHFITWNHRIWLQWSLWCPSWGPGHTSAVF